MTDVRKNLIILVFVLSGALVSLLVLNFQKPGKGQQAQILGAQSNALKNYPVKISRGVVNFFGLKNGSGKVVFYEELDSIVYELDFDGRNKKELARIPDASDFVFSPNGKELVATLSENGSSKKTYFNLENNRKIELDKNIDSVAFSPDGKKLAYHFYDSKNGEGGILISESGGSDFKNIFRTRIKNLNLFWPKSELIIFFSKGENNPPVFSITPDGKEFLRMAEEELISYLNQEMKEMDIFRELGIEATEIKLSPLKDYLIFINAGDGKLYSLGL